MPDADAVEERFRQVFEEAGADAAALERLLGALNAAYAERVRRFVASRQVAADDVDDVCQQTWVAAWKALPNFRLASTFSTWLTGIANNKVKDLRRKRKQPERDGASSLLAKLSATSHKGPSRQLALKRLEEIVAEIIGELEPEDILILDLHEEELSLEEIGSALGITKRQVSRRILAIRGELETKLAVRLGDAD